MVHAEFGGVVGNDAARIDYYTLYARLTPMFSPPLVVVSLWVALNEVRLAPSKYRLIPWFLAHRFLHIAAAPLEG
jgi:hypothetical protein